MFYCFIVLLFYCNKTIMAICIRSAHSVVACQHRHESALARSYYSKETTGLCSAELCRNARCAGRHRHRHGQHHRNCMSVDLQLANGKTHTTTPWHSNVWRHLQKEITETVKTIFPNLAIKMCEKRWFEWMSIFWKICVVEKAGLVLLFVLVC